MPPPSPSASRRVYADLRGFLICVTLLAVVSAVAGLWAEDPRIAAVSAVLAAAGLLRVVSTPPLSTSSPVAAALAGAFVNGLVSGLALVLSLAAAEGAMRWIYRDVTSTADFRGYFTRKWLRADVRHNHYGYRGAEFDEAKPHGVFRVAVLGDSFTYGNGVPEASRYSNLVADAVRSRGIEVLNFGFPGNNWSEHVQTLEHRVLRLRPDVVLLQWGSNDIELDRDVAGRPHVPPLIWRRDWHEWLYERSALYTMLNAQWLGVRLRRQMGDTYDQYLTHQYASPESEGARQADTLMRRFIALCREHGIGVALVLFPDAAVSLGADYPYRFMHDQVHGICASERVTCLDLLSTLAAEPDRYRLWVTPLDSHPSELANQIAADRILETLAPAWGRQAH